MGKITAKGSAEAEYTSDLIEVTLDISVEGKTTGGAIKAGKEKTEQLLKVLDEKLEIKPGDIIMDRYDISTDYKAEKYLYIKLLKFMVPADLKLIEQLSVLMEEMTGIKLSLSEKLSTKYEKENEVMKLAIENSRKSAESIAVALGQRITGAESIDYNCGRDTEMYGEREFSPFAKSLTIDDMASKLKNPVIKISKSITIEWLTEDIK